MGGVYLDPLRRRSGFPEPALRLTDRHEPGLSRAAIQQSPGPVSSLPRHAVGSEVQKMPGQIQRPFAQVRRRIRRAPQDRQHVDGFQRRADAAPDRSDAVADMQRQVQTQRIADR